MILIAGTHGRGVYAMDISFIREMAPEIFSSEIHLFKTSDAKLPKWRWWYWAGIRQANIAFFMKKNSPVEIKIKDSAGKIVKSFNKSGEKGLNFVKWGLKPDKPQKKNPYVKDGLYHISITGSGFTAEGKVKVVK